MTLAEGGAATWYNPAWWFVLGVERVFVRISHGASRLQEILADRWAVLAYGSEAFERGLRHVIARSVQLDAHVDATVREVVASKEPLANLYTHAPATRPDADAIDRAVREAIAAHATVYASHPAPKDRFASARALACKGDPPRDGDDDNAWSLFEERAVLEEAMTHEVRSILLNAHGVVIAGAPRA